MNALLPLAAQYLGSEGEDPSAPFWASGNYVGPYWSDGALQESVEWGNRPALNELDALARQHDAAYAHYKDERHREAADALFAEGASKLKGKYGDKLAEDPRVAATLVKYGNYAARKASKLPEYASMGGLGILKYGYDHIKEMTQRIDGSYLSKEKSDVRKFYEADVARRPIGPRGKDPGARIEQDSPKTTIESFSGRQEEPKSQRSSATPHTPELSYTPLRAKKRYRKLRKKQLMKPHKQKLPRAKSKN